MTISKDRKLPEKDNLLFSSKEKEVIELLDIMQSVDVNSDDAELNISSMSDNNGGRILF